MLVRFSYWLCLLPASGGIATGVIKDVLRGHTRHFDEPLFWLPVIAFILVTGAIVWLIPWGKLNRDTYTGLDTLCRIRTVPWAEITQCKIGDIPGVSYVRLYTPKSRFAVWL